jgi:hypothetical protein
MNESDAKKWQQQFQREAKVTKDFFRDVQKNEPTASSAAFAAKDCCHRGKKTKRTENLP